MDVRTADIPASHIKRTGTIVRFIACQHACFQSRCHCKRFISGTRLIGVADDRITPELIEAVIDGHLLFFLFSIRFRGSFLIVLLHVFFRCAACRHFFGGILTALFSFLLFCIRLHLINLLLGEKLQKVLFIHRIVQVIWIGGRHAKHLSVSGVHDQNTGHLASHIFIKFFQFIFDHLLNLHINGTYNRIAILRFLHRLFLCKFLIKVIVRTSVGSV